MFSRVHSPSIFLHSTSLGARILFGVRAAASGHYVELAAPSRPESAGRGFAHVSVCLVASSLAESFEEIWRFHPKSPICKGMSQNQNHNRQPKGTPVGGQSSCKVNPKATSDLAGRVGSNKRKRVATARPKSKLEVLIKQLCEEEGLRLQDLADKVFIDRRRMSRVLHEKRPPTVAELKFWATVLNAPFDELARAAADVEPDDQLRIRNFLAKVQRALSLTPPARARALSSAELTQLESDVLKLKGEPSGRKHGDQFERLLLTAKSAIDVATGPAERRLRTSLNELYAIASSESEKYWARELTAHEELVNNIKEQQRKFTGVA